MDIPTDISLVDDDTELEPIFRFIKNTVSLFYGKRRIVKSLKNNPGSSLLDLVTMSDIAYGLTLVENSKEVWDEDFEILQLTPEEQAKWKNPKSLPPDERVKYTKTRKPKYTSRKGRKAKYMEPGMNEEGIKSYEARWKKWKALARHKESWEMLQEGWITYQQKYDTGLGQQWVAKSPDRAGMAQSLEPPPSNRFSMPGDDEFEHDRAVRVSDEGLDEEPPHKRAREDGGDSDSSSDGGDE